MKAAFLTISILAGLALGGCAENSIPRLTAIQPLNSADSFVITGVECVAAPGVAMETSDLDRNMQLTRAALRSARPSAKASLNTPKQPLKLRVTFTSYQSNRKSVLNIVPVISHMWSAAILSFVDHKGESIGRYKVYNGFWVGTALISSADIDVGLQQGIQAFVEKAGIEVAMPPTAG